MSIVPGTSQSLQHSLNVFEIRSVSRTCCRIIITVLQEELRIFHARFISIFPKWSACKPAPFGNSSVTLLNLVV